MIPENSDARPSISSTMHDCAFSDIVMARVLSILTRIPMMRFSGWNQSEQLIETLASLHGRCGRRFRANLHLIYTCGELRRRDKNNLYLKPTFRRRWAAKNHCFAVLIFPRVVWVHHVKDLKHLILRVINAVIIN